jgi:hypothetical protein
MFNSRSGGHTQFKKLGTGCSPEYKFKDVADTGNALVAGTPQVISSTIVSVDQNDGVSGRDGRLIKLKHLNMKIHVAWTADSDAATFAAQGGRVRLVLVKDKQANGAAPQWTDVFTSNANDDTTDFPKLENERRFRILRDVIIQPSAFCSGGGFDGSTTDVDAAGRDSYHVWNMKFNTPIEYLDTGNGVADIASNNLVLLAAAEGTNATLDMYSRIRYED